MSIYIETDDRSRLTLPGHSNERFLVRENSDGSLLFEPARIVSEAQAEYDSNPELRDLLDRANVAPTVKRSYTRRR